MKTDDPQRQPSQASPGDVGDGAWAWLTNGVLIRFLLFFASGWAFVQLLSYFELLVVVFISSHHSGLFAQPSRSLAEQLDAPWGSGSRYLYWGLDGAGQLIRYGWE